MIGAVKFSVFFICFFSTVRGRERMQSAECLRSRITVHELPGRPPLRVPRGVHRGRVRRRMLRLGRVFAGAVRQRRSVPQQRGQLPVFVSARIRRRPVPLVQRYATNKSGPPPTTNRHNDTVMLYYIFRIHIIVINETRTGSAAVDRG